MSDQFATMLGILNGKIQDQARLIDEQDADIVSLRHNIQDLENCLRVAKVELASHMKPREVAKVELASHMKPREVVQQPSPLWCYESAAKHYIHYEGGKALWLEGQKIAVIKAVRNITGWCLKDTKDFCVNECGAPM